MQGDAPRAAGRGPSFLLSPLGIVFTTVVIDLVGFGIVLPILPFLIERISGTTNAAALSWHTGLVTGTYILAIFLFAPAWGKLSDRWGRRPVLLMGLTVWRCSLSSKACPCSTSAGSLTACLRRRLRRRHMLSLGIMPPQWNGARTVSP